MSNFAFIALLLIPALNAAPRNISKVACDPPLLFTCNSILDFYKCIYFGMLSPIVDCHETDDAVYWRMDQYLTWDNAKFMCNYVGVNADLTSIHNYEEFDIVRRLAEAKSINAYPWIGLKCNSMTDCTWSDHSPVDYLKWLVNIHSDFNKYNCGILYGFNANPHAEDSFSKQYGMMNAGCSDPNKHIGICKATL